MLAVLPEPATARAVPSWLDPDLNRERETSASPGGWPWLADFPSPANDDIEPSLNLNDHLIRNPESTFLVRVAGEALADAGLHDGDLLVMDRATPPLAGNVVLAIVDGTPVLTRLSRNTQGRLRVQAPGPGTDLSQPLDGATMVGVARWVIHRLWPGRRGDR
jgi:DNA polymerase V